MHCVVAAQVNLKSANCLKFRHNVKCGEIPLPKDFKALKDLKITTDGLGLAQERGFRIFVTLFRRSMTKNSMDL